MTASMSDKPAEGPLARGEQYKRQLQWHACDFPKVPVPIYRHAAPSAPWPWMDFDADVSEVQPRQGASSDTVWDQYPQNLFGNWTHDQVNRSQMLTKCSDSELSTIYKIGVLDDARFDKHVEVRAVRKDDDTDLLEYWKDLGVPPSSNVRLQALFVEDLTLPVLQMLGTRFNVEPFFFASSVNWIPSRYREDPKDLEDHITVVLPFIRILKNQRPIKRARPLSIGSLASTETQSLVEHPLPYMEEAQVMNTQAAVSLPENKILLQDLLSLHMVRKTTTSTIISYHPSLQGTSAQRLQSLMHMTGESVYWSNIFRGSKDPTFIFLATLWYALYEWDAAFEVLYHYVNVLEHKVLQLNDLKLTRELHKLQAHFSSYELLLRDFICSVEFVRDTPNPAMNTLSVSQEERDDSAKVLHIEANNLISEIERLTRQRELLSDRIDNALRLALGTVGIEETKSRQRLVGLVMLDSAVMKQLAYLSIIYLPATYLTNVFRMHVHGIDAPAHATQTLLHYIEATIGFTLFTVWLTIAMQKDSSFYPTDSGALHRTLWPLFYAYGTACKSKAWLVSVGSRFRREDRFPM